METGETASMKLSEWEKTAKAASLYFFFEGQIACYPTRGGRRVQGLGGQFGASAFPAHRYSTGADSCPTRPDPANAPGNTAALRRTAKMRGPERWFPYAGSIVDRAKNSAGIVSQGILQSTGLSDSLLQAEQVMNTISSDMREAAAAIAAGQAQKQLRLAKEQYMERLKAENDGMTTWQNTLVRKNGYTVDNRISRNTVVASTLFENVRETQTVHKYQAFETAAATVSVNLEQSALDGLDDHAMMLLVKQAQSELATWGEKIFGEVDEEGATKEWQIPRSRMDAAVKEYQSITDEETTQAKIDKIKTYADKDFDDMSDGEKEKYGKLMDSMITVRDGELGQHIGWAPLFKSGEDLNLDKSRERNISSAGRGQMGAIMTDFQWNSMLASKGYAEMAKPMYDKPMWDDRGDVFKAPTIKSVVDIAVTVAATAITAPIGGVAGIAVSAAINLADDAVFLMADVAGGLKSWAEVGVEFGKKAAISAATSLVNVGINGVGGKMVDGVEQIGGFTGKIGGLASVIPQEGFSNVIGSTALAGLSALSNGAITSSVNAIQYSDEGGFGWSQDAFDAGMSGAWMSAATGMTSAFVSGGLNLGMEGFYGEINKNGRTLSNLTGSLAGQGMNYALGGNFTLNLLNASNFSDKLNGGLLELSFGRDGISSQIGMGGADVNMSKLAQSFKGLEAWKVNLDMFGSGQREAGKYSSALRSLYSAGGGSADRGLFDSILAGMTNVEENANGDYKGKTTLDEVTGIKTLSLGKDALADGSRFGLNILFAHEAYRDGLEGTKEEQETERNQAVVGHIRAAANLGQSYGMNMLTGADREEIAALREASQVNGDQSALAGILGSYDSTADYWKLNVLKDAQGKVIGHSMTWDGKLDYDLSELGLGNINAVDMTPAKMTELIATFAEKGIKVNGRDVTLADLQAIQTVNTNMTAFQNSVAGGAGYNHTTAETNRISFLNSLYALQGKGLISGNNSSQVDSALVAQGGSGTFASPYKPIKGTLQETTMFGYRLNIDGVVNPDETDFAEMRVFEHTANDYSMLGGTSYFAMFGGSMSLAADKNKGLYSTITDASGNKQETAHNGSQTVAAFMNIWGGSAKGLNADRILTGVAAGSNIGAYANTGLSTSAHLHLQLWDVNAQGNSKWVDTAEVFRKTGFSVNTTANAQAYSGYRIPGGEAKFGEFMQTKAFAEKFFGQSLTSLNNANGIVSDMRQVMLQNRLFDSPGFTALPVATVNPYLQNWYRYSRQEDQLLMQNYASQYQNRRYTEWLNIPREVRQSFGPFY